MRAGFVTVKVQEVGSVIIIRISCLSSRVEVNPESQLKLVCIILFPAVGLGSAATLVEQFVVPAEQRSPPVKVSAKA
jgi:hypothetical protein